MSGVRGIRGDARSAGIAQHVVAKTKAPLETRGARNDLPRTGIEPARVLPRGPASSPSLRYAFSRSLLWYLDKLNTSPLGEHLPKPMTRYMRPSGNEGRLNSLPRFAIPNSENDHRLLLHPSPEQAFEWILLV